MDKKNIFEKKLDRKKATYYILMTVCVLAIAVISFISYKSVQNALSEDKLNNTPDNVDKVDSNVENVSGNEEPVTEQQPEDTSAETNQQVDEPVNAQPEIETKAYIMPLESEEITAVFSLTTPIYSQTLKDWRIHDGIDIAAELDTNVLAVNDGVIETIENNDLFGITVVIKHTDGKKSTYCNLADNVELEEGQVINRGDIVGKVGNTAVFEISDGPHLHFEMSENGNKIDPLSIIKVQD